MPDLNKSAAQRIVDAEFAVPYLPREAILEHPRFAEARDLYLQAVLALYGDDPFLNKLLLESARSVVFGGLMVLAASHDPATRATWPTLGNLKRLIAPFAQSSPRRIEQIVLRLIEVGYLEQHPSPVDARLRLLTPTRRFIRHDQDWLAAHYQPLARLYPDPAYDRPLTREPTFQMAQRSASFAFIPRSAQVFASNPDILLFAARDAGFLILAQMVLDDRQGVRRSFDEMGRRFAVSRTHVRQLLQDAQARGLIALSGPGGHDARILAPGWLCIDRFVADGMSGHDLTGALALKQIASQDRESIREAV